MNTWEKIFYGFCIGTILAGIEILITWAHASKLFGIALIFIPLMLIYIYYTKNRKEVAYIHEINIQHCCLGLVLILIDVAYNLYASDAFRDLDYGILSIGFIIILLNMNLFRFLKLDEKMISFVTYFLFIFISVYAFLFGGIGIIFGASEHPVFVPMARISTRLSAFFLNFIAPTTIYAEGGWRGINFNGFKVGIASVCSGVESITVFLSAIVAYFIATKELPLRKMCIYTIAGACILFFMNIFRIMIITVVGYYKGGEAMLFVHTNLGWILFALAMMIFWYMVTQEK